MRSAWLAAFALLLANACPAATLGDYGQLPTLEKPTISPDAKSIAFESTVNGERMLVIRALDEKFTPIAFLKLSGQKVRAIAWADNRHVLFGVSKTSHVGGIAVYSSRGEFFQVQSYDIVTHQASLLMSRIDNAMNTVFGMPDIRTVDGHVTAFATGSTFNGEGKNVAALYAIDLTTGATKLIEKGSDTAYGWEVGDDGSVIAEVDYDDHARLWTLLLHRDRRFIEVMKTPAPIETPELLGLTPDGKALMVASMDNGDAKYQQVDLASGAVGPTLDLGDAANSPIFDPVTHRMIGMTQVGDGFDYKFFDKADQANWNALKSPFPGETVTIESWSADRKTILVMVEGKRDGAAYFLIDLANHKAEPLGAVYAGITPDDYNDVTVIRYKAADGTTIPAYLTLPKGRSAKGLPLVVLPHGGPAARDMPGFDWWSQALAASGYAVLQPEFRGSDGYGWKHLSAGFGEWGRKMQTDLSDGVRYLAAAGIIDPARVCIVGASYGGYAALAGPTLDRGVYRCAASVSGIGDLRAFRSWVVSRDHSSDDATLRFWDRFMGAKDGDDSTISQISPIAHLDGVTTPFLLVHGKDDTVVPIGQSEDMNAALTRAGIPVTFVQLDGEDHWLSRSETRLKMLDAVVTFLKANNPP